MTDYIALYGHNFTGDNDVTIKMQKYKFLLNKTKLKVVIKDEWNKTWIKPNYMKQSKTKIKTKIFTIYLSALNEKDWY